eukprot:scaffold67780_cov19-Tisochrysis_lutea.AAC.1
MSVFPYLWKWLSCAWQGYHASLGYFLCAKQFADSNVLLHKEPGHAIPPAEVASLCLAGLPRAMLKTQESTGSGDSMKGASGLPKCR